MIVSNKIRWCLMIVAGDRLGIQCQGMAVKLAKAILFDGYEIPSWDILYLSTQSEIIIKQLLESGRIEEANKIAGNILNELSV